MKAHAPRTAISAPVRTSSTRRGFSSTTRSGVEVCGGTCQGGGGTCPPPVSRFGGNDRAWRVAQAIPPLVKNRGAGSPSLRLAVGAHARPVAPIPNRAMAGRLAVLGALAMANVHGSLGAPLQTRPDIERKTGGGRGWRQYSARLAPLSGHGWLSSDRIRFGPCGAMERSKGSAGRGASTATRRKCSREEASGWRCLAPAAVMSHAARVRPVTIAAFSPADICRHASICRRSMSGDVSWLSTSTRNDGHERLWARVAGCARSALGPDPSAGSGSSRARSRDEGTNTSPYLCPQD